MARESRRTAASSMTYDSERHHRRSIRLPGYDYAQPGAYFVTVCTAQGECLFGEIVDAGMTESAYGVIARDEWFRSAAIRSEIVLDPDEFVVMPNHIHGIVRIAGDVGATGGSPLRTADADACSTGRSALRTADCGAGVAGRPPLRTQQPGPPPHSLGAIMAGYKAVVTKRINQNRGTPGMPVWQRNYWEHVIRDEAELQRIREYIQTNPARWCDDQLHCTAPRNRFNQEQSVHG
jgi:putative transposase